MDRIEYTCDECAHRFGTPPGVPRDTRALMCPACGCAFVSLAIARRPAPRVMRAVAPPAAARRRIRRARAS
jgi:DNA-directed RNA polymerase subunit RPC12/RpoP